MPGGRGVAAESSFRREKAAADTPCAKRTVLCRLVQACGARRFSVSRNGARRFSASRNGRVAFDGCGQPHQGVYFRPKFDGLSSQSCSCRRPRARRADRSPLLRRPRPAGVPGEDVLGCRDGAEELPPAGVGGRDGPHLDLPPGPVAHEVGHLAHADRTVPADVDALTVAGPGVDGGRQLCREIGGVDEGLRDSGLADPQQAALVERVTRHGRDLVEERPLVPFGTACGAECYPDSSGGTARLLIASVMV